MTEGCPLSCRPIMKVFIRYKRPLVRTPDDKPWSLCIGLKRISSVKLVSCRSKQEAMKVRRALLDWLDTPAGVGVYREALRQFVMHHADIFRGE